MRIHCRAPDMPVSANYLEDPLGRLLPWNHYTSTNMTWTKAVAPELGQGRDRGVRYASFLQSRPYRLKQTLIVQC